MDGQRSNDRSWPPPRDQRIRVAADSGKSNSNKSPNRENYKRTPDQNDKYTSYEDRPRTNDEGRYEISDDHKKSRENIQSQTSPGEIIRDGGKQSERNSRENEDKPDVLNTLNRDDQAPTKLDAMAKEFIPRQKLEPTRNDKTRYTPDTLRRDVEKRDTKDGRNSGSNSGTIEERKENKTEFRRDGGSEGKIEKRDDGSSEVDKRRARDNGSPYSNRTREEVQTKKEDKDTSERDFPRRDQSPTDLNRGFYKHDRDGKRNDIDEGSVKKFGRRGDENKDLDKRELERSNEKRWKQ